MFPLFFFWVLKTFEAKKKTELSTQKRAPHLSLRYLKTKSSFNSHLDFSFFYTATEVFVFPRNADQQKVLSACQQCFTHSLLLFSHCSVCLLFTCAQFHRFFQIHLHALSKSPTWSTSCWFPQRCHAERPRDNTTDYMKVFVMVCGVFCMCTKTPIIPFFIFLKLIFFSPFFFFFIFKNK